MVVADESARIFKAAWFAKSARKARIEDGELCEAIEDVIAGRADDLGGGVYKKRLDKNRYRSIVLAKGGRYWIFQYLFAKRNRSNIDGDELKDFRILAKGYASLNQDQISELLMRKDLTEICHDNKKSI